MIEIFGVEDGRAEPIGRGEEGGVVVVELISTGQGETGRDVGLIDRHEWERAEEQKPVVDLSVLEQLLAPRDIGKLGQALPRDPEQRTENEIEGDVETARITIPLRNRVEEDVRVEK